MLKRIFFFVLFKIAFLHPVIAQDSTAVHYSSFINASSLSMHLHKLASDEFEGRETGQKGQHLTSRYISAHFDSIGIPPLNNGSFLQEYPLEMLHPQGVTIQVKQSSFVFIKDFYYIPGFQDTVIRQDQIVFLGYGIDDKNYSDYKNKINLKGKIIIILAGDPMDDKGNSLVTKTEKLSDWSTSWKKKITYAKSFHPAAVFVVVNSLKNSVSKIKHTIEAPTVKTHESNKEGNIPYFYISKAMTNKILGTRKRSIKNLQKKIVKEPEASHSFEFQSEIKLNVVRNTNKLTASNVLGYIEGSDLKEEVIVISAHLDHLGKSGNTIYYGADDDGSGTSAIMNIAAAFSKAKKEGHGPRRSILIIAFSGEEKGLLGSKFYVEHPVFPLKNTFANLNIDMIGRVDEKHVNQPDYVYLIGSEKLSSSLYKINERVNATHTKLEIDYTFNEPGDPNRFFYRSDHYNFAKNNIPVVFYFNGAHADYHKPTDTVDKINFDLLEKRARLIFLTAWSLSNSDEKLKIIGKNNQKKN